MAIKIENEAFLVLPNTQTAKLFAAQVSIGKGVTIIGYKPGASNAEIAEMIKAVKGNRDEQG